MKKLAVLWALVCALASAQLASAQQFRTSTVDPVGSCSTDVVYNQVSGALWGCRGGVFTPITGGAGGIGGSGTPGKPAKFITDAHTIGDSGATDVVGLFTGCSGTLYLGADGSCHTATVGSGLITNAIVSALTPSTIQTPSAAATLDANGNANVLSVTAGSGSGKTGYLEPQGVTSGGQGFTVADIAGTPTLYIIPTAPSSGGLLKDNGSGTCPTLPAGAPSACEQLAWSSTIANSSVTATPVPTPGTALTMTAPRGYGICTGTCTVSIPVPAAGNEFCILNDDNVATAITLSALGASAMYENSARTAYGTAGTGTLVVAAAAANKVCIIGRDATHYFTVSNTGGAITVN